MGGRRIALSLVLAALVAGAVALAWPRSQFDMVKELARIAAQQGP